jgi:GPH family glycoside/pentoside/hexuronide:cation symporter
MAVGRRIKLSTKLAYGSGQVAEGLKNGAFGLFIMFYYNQVLGVSGTLCGLALGVALIFDAVTDPLAGSLSDNLHSRLGRRHPFMYASAIPLGLAFFGLFSPPELSEWGLVAWLLVFSVLTRAAMTLYHVPHMALGAELSEDFHERTTIVAYRLAFSYLGGLLTAAIAFTFFFTEAKGGRFNVAGYSQYALVLSCIMVVTIWWSAFGTRKEIPHLPGPANTAQGPVLGRLFAETKSAFGNESFGWLFAGVLIVFLMVGVDGALNLYIYQYFWELIDNQILLMTVATPVGLILGTLFTKGFHRRFDKKPALVFGTGGWALLQIIPILLRVAGWFPENHTAALVWSLASFKFLQGMIVQQALVTFGSMMADVVDEHELASGRRQEGIFFGAVAFSGKGAAGLGNIFAGVGLDLISWPRGMDIQTAADVPPETLLWLGLLYGPIVSGFGVVSVWCYTHYHLTREKHDVITTRLHSMREEAAELAASEPF